MSKNMTALISAFARAYHYKNNDTSVFSDNIAQEILTHQEYENISENMAKGISFFNPMFNGSADEAVRWIVNNYLSPSPIGRSAFAENRLKQEVNLGVSQYLIFAAGYDSFAYRQPTFFENIEIFEIDKSEMIDDKVKRVRPYLDEINNINFIKIDFEKEKTSQKLLEHEKFKKDKKSFCSLLGISYYLEKSSFANMLEEISSIVPEGSSIVFDYPDEKYYTDFAGERAKKQTMMANAAGEVMKSSYSYSVMGKLLSDHGFLIYEHLTPDEITKQYFSEYNAKNPNDKISAFDNVNYLFAVKKG